MYKRVAPQLGANEGRGTRLARTLLTRRADHALVSMLLGSTLLSSALCVSGVAAAQTPGDRTLAAAPVLLASASPPPSPTAASGTQAGSSPSTSSAPPPSTQATTSAPLPVELGEIVVTAQKRSENIQNVPIAISTFSATQLAARGVEALSDLADVTPALEYSTSAAAILPRIRGVGAQISTAGDENAVATYIDGVYIASGSSSALMFNNIDQVSVLKGPQGTLFGRNATGGVIQITTPDPKSLPQGHASVTYGNLDTTGADLYVTGGVTQNVATDLAVYWDDQHDGFGKNLFDDHDYGKQNNLALRNKWKLDLDPATQIRISVDYANVDGPYGGYTPVPGAKAALGPPYTGGPFDVDTNADYHERVEQWGTSINISHDFDRAKLTSITAYRSSRAYSYGDFDGTPVPFLLGGVLLDELEFTQELQLVSQGSGPFKWATGFYYFHGDAHETDDLVLGPELSDNHSRQYTDSEAVFGQASYDFTSKTSLTVGLRYTEETKDYAGASQMSVFGAVIPSEPAAGKLSEGQPTWRVALDQHLTHDILAYLSYNRGFKSGGFNLSNGVAPAQSFKPETLDAYEAGLKADFLDRRLRVDAAAYYYDYKNIQINVFTADGIPVPQSGGPATIYGFDSDITAVPFRGLNVTAGIAYEHTRFDDFPDAPISVALPSGGSFTELGSATGNHLPDTPTWSLNLGVDYERQLPVGSIRLAVNEHYSSGFYGEADNRLAQSPYSVVNATTTWYLDNEKLYSVELWGKNLCNTAYATEFQAGLVVDTRVIAAGRTFGVTLGAKF